MFKLNDPFIFHKNIKKQTKDENIQSENMLMTSRNCEYTPASQQVTASKKSRIELQCRKELKLFFQLKHSRNEGIRLSNVKHWLITLLSLFKGHKNEEKLQNELYSLDTRFSSIYKQPKWGNQNIIKDGLPLLFILTIHLPSPLERQTFDFELLTTNAKNIYRKIHFHNWQIIFSQLNQIRLKNDKIIYFVEGRGNALAFLAQNKEFSILLQQFINLQKVNGDELMESLQSNPVLSIKEPEAKLIQRVLKHYQYLKSSLIRQFGWLNLPITPSKRQFLIIISNLIASLPIFDEEGDILERIKPYKWAVAKAIRKCLKWDLAPSSSHHYPASLENAQACWVCKRRVYIHCPTCSQNEGKRTSLCLQCYESYHRELNQRDEGNSAMVQEWEALDGKVEAMLWQSFRG